MNPLGVAFGTSLRALLSPGRFLSLGVATLCLLAFVLLPAPGAQEDLFASRVEIFRACLLLPGILVALELRRAWPALGPEDEAQVWLHLTGTPAWLPRLGALLGGVCALLALLAFQALLLGLGLNLLPDRPAFEQAVALHKTGEPTSHRFLVQPGDVETFDVAGQVVPEQVLFLRPLWSYGPPDPIEVEIRAADTAEGWQSLGRTAFRMPGETRRFALPSGIGELRRIQIRRLSASGTMISLDLGEILLLGQALGPIPTAYRATLPYLFWALLMLLAALALSALLSPGLWGLAVLCLLPTIGMTPGLPTDHSGAHLGQGFSSIPDLPGTPAVVLALALLILGVLWPRRIRARELAS